MKNSRGVLLVATVLVFLGFSHVRSDDGKSRGDFPASQRQLMNEHIYDLELSLSVDDEGTYYFFTQEKPPAQEQGKLHKQEGEKIEKDQAEEQETPK